MMFGISRLERAEAMDLIRYYEWYVWLHILLTTITVSWYEKTQIFTTIAFVTFESEILQHGLKWMK